MSEMRKTAFCVEIGRATREDYERAKRILNIGKHPTFVGRGLVEKNAINGGLLFFIVDGVDAGVAVVNPRRSVLLVMNVAPCARSIGLGSSMLRFLKPNFVRAVESAVPWFEMRGYKSIGEWKVGRKLRTRVMVRESLISLAGRLRSAIGRQCGQVEMAGQHSKRIPDRTAKPAERSTE